MKSKFYEILKGVSINAGKKLVYRSILVFAVLALVFVSCKKQLCIGHDEQHVAAVKPVYSSITEFREGISKVVNFIRSNHIYAYLDTLPNGYPNVEGRKAPLEQFGYTILEKLRGNQQQIESAVYDVFHFDGASFSLISFLMKAQMAGNISAHTLATIISAIPLPPIPIEEFQPPVVQVAVDTPEVNCCDHCNPSLKVLVTWTYKAPCGNYEKKTSGYAANNTLTHMSGGKIYRFDAEVTGCDCPGATITSSVQAPGGASYGTGSPSAGSVTLFPVTPGVYTITFTYKNCDKVVTKTFTLQID
ncbi:MAG: hypothetical protein NVS3B8_05170 [Chitinophagaceae bacterium]